MSSPRVVLLSIVIATSLMADTAGAAAKRLPSVRTSVTGNSTTLFLNLGARARYSPTWIDARTYALDITGASTELRPENRMVNSPLVSSYRVFGYDGSDGRPHIRVELSLTSQAKVDAEQSKGIVTVRVRSEASSPSPTPAASGASLSQQASAGSANDRHSVPASPEPESKASASRAETPQSKRATAIREVQVAKLEGTSALEVQILGNGIMEYRTLRLTNPERVVVDIPNATNHIRQKQLSVNTRPLRAVRIGQLSQRPLVTRIVMDLDTKTAYQVRREATSLVVTLDDSGAANAGENKKSFPSGSPELSPEKLNGALPAYSASAPNLGLDARMENLEENISVASAPLESGELSTEPATAAAPEMANPASAAVPETVPASQPVIAEIEPTQATTPNITGNLQPSSQTDKTDAATESVAMATAEPANKSDAVNMSPAAQEAASVAAPPVGSVEQTAPPLPAAAPTSPAGEPQLMASLAANAEPAAEAAMEPAIAREPQPAPTWRISDSSLAPLAINAKRTETAAFSGAVPATPNSVNPNEPRREFLAKPVAGNSQAPAPMLLAQQTATPAAGGAAPAARSAYSGEPISVNLKDVDLKDFFRLIHEISGLNVVLDPTVSGQVTIVLDEVPWDQAMDVVMRNNGLGKEVEGNVVRIAKLDTLNTEQEARRKLAESVQKAAPMVTVPRTLSYAKANDLITTLKKFLSERGDMVADNRTNTLLITDTPERITQVEGLIKTLDQKSLQVEIEARVVSASRSFARDIGSQLAASGLTGNVVLGGVGAVGESPIKRGITPPLFLGSPPAPAVPGQPAQFANVAQPLLTNLPAAGATSGFSFLLTRGSNIALDAIITAAESRGIGKLLSRPKIITQNNVEAIVKQGVKIPIQTTINNTVSIQYVDVVLRLTVTPQITAEGTIFLKTDIENTSIDPGIATTPGQFGLDTQSAQTQVLVSNGGTVFFGGVVQNINRVSESEVPLLGSIPLVGNMFKHKSTTSTTNELLFFITPRIVQS